MIEDIKRQTRERAEMGGKVLGEDWLLDEEDDEL